MQAQSLFGIQPALVWVQLKNCQALGNLDCAGVGLITGNEKHQRSQTLHRDSSTMRVALWLPARNRSNRFLVVFRLLLLKSDFACLHFLHLLRCRQHDLLLIFPCMQTFAPIIKVLPRSIERLLMCKFTSY